MGSTRLSMWERQTGRERHTLVHHTSINVSSMHDFRGLDTYQCDVVARTSARFYYKDSGVILLPSSTTKLGSLISKLLWPALWGQLLHWSVAPAPPQHICYEAYVLSDLCWVCQQNSAAITRSANRPEKEKSVVPECVHGCGWRF